MNINCVFFVNELVINILIVFVIFLNDLLKFGERIILKMLLKLKWLLEFWGIILVYFIYVYVVRFYFE